MFKKLLIAVICLTVVMGVITDVTLLCHSSCGTCPSFPRDQNGCSTCSSVFLNYLPIAVDQAPKACTPDPNYSAHANAQLLYVIDGSSTIGDSHLEGYIIGENTISTQQSLASLGVYSSNNLASLISPLTPEITFQLNNLGANHYGIFFRLYAYCQGSSAQSFYYRVDSPAAYPSQSIGFNQYQLIEPTTRIKHSSNTLELSFGFGLTGTCTSRQISEVSVYIMKCAQGCTTCNNNAYNCTTCAQDYIFNSVTKKCIPTKFCHSRCGSCSVKNDATKCTSCSSSILNLSYQPFTVGQTSGSCLMTSTNNAQHLLTVNKNTVLGSSILKSVTYNGITHSTNGDVLATFLYSQQVIEFKNLINNVVTFGFQTTTIHQKIIVRARVFTQCSTENRTLTMTLSGSATPTIVTQTIPSMTESIIEGEIVQSAEIFTVEFFYGTQSQTCHKMIQDITIYYEKCLPYCGSNDCPDTQPYYKQLNTLQCVNDCSPNFADTEGLQCVADCPNGYTQNGNICVPLALCSSTCGTCSVENDPTKCTTCLSTFTSSLNYVSFGDGLVQLSCTFTPTNNAQYLLTIDKNSVIGSSNLQSVNINSLTQSTLGTPLSPLVYSQNTIEFMTLTSNIVSFTLQALPPHQKIFVRARVYTQCLSTQNKSINLILSGGTPVTVTKTLTELTQDIIQGQVVHNDLTFTITIQFGAQSQTCRKNVQDISVFYEKCQPHCGSNSCPDALPHFKLQGQNVCVNDCPNGYTENGNNCVKTTFCHSTCGQCTLKNDVSQCSTCTSTSALSYQPFPNSQTTGPCTPTITNNAQYLLTINKDTVIGPNTDPNSLISVTYNSSIVQSTLTTALSSFLYIENVIEFTTLSSNTVVFNFDSLPAQHEKIIVRAKVFTECSGSQDKTVQLTLSGSTPTVTNTTLTPLLQTIVEGEVLHTTSTFTLTVAFGTQSETCRKIVQDISLYFEKCSSFCGSNDCPATLSYYRDPTSAVCVSDCPDGYTEAGDLCVETKFCHSTCGACTIMNDATKCTSCSSTLGSLVYEPFAAGVTETTCAMTATNNAQLLMTVDKDTPLGGTSYLQSVTYNTIPEIALTPLSAFLYTQNVIEVSSLTNNTLVFDFGISPIHQKLLVRARVFTECTTENTTVQMTLSGGTPTVVTQSLSTNTATIIEGEVAHNSATFTLTFQFGTQVETCRKQIQDISIYYQRCQAYCGSNDCPDTEPYYKHPIESRCLNDCPNGYFQSGQNCLPFQFCDSSCGTCITKNNPLLCQTCSSSFTSSLVYSTFTVGTEAPCTFDSLNNAQFLYKIDKTAVLGSGLLTSVTYNNLSPVQTVGTLISSFLYTQNVIDFSRFTSSNLISFGFSALPIHQKLIVRARLFTQCISQNKSVQMTLTSTTNTVASTTLTTGIEGLIQGEVIHDSTTFILKFQFGTATQTCLKMIQDITIYSQKCKTICGSNVCPDALPYYKNPDPLINQCMSLCPPGYYENGDICEAVALCHSTCNTCELKNDASSCTDCSSTLTSLLYDTPIAGPSSWGCTFPLTNKAQILITIDKDTQIGNSLLKNVTFNSTNNANLGDLLSGFLYTNNILDFVSLNSNRVQFYFDGLPIHKKLLVRARVQSSCAAALNQSISVTLQGTSPATINQTLTPDQQTIIQGQVVHQTTTFSIIIQFGTQGQNCHKLLQDITIFYEKCQSYCNSNVCPDFVLYYKHPTLDQCISDCTITTPTTYGESLSNLCVTDCELGRYPVGSVCVDYEFCSSTCHTCSLKQDPLKCTACPTMTGLNYNLIPASPGDGPCTMTPTNNAQFLFNINKNTPLVTDLLKSVTYNIQTEQTSGKLLSQFLYSRNVIQFQAFPQSNQVSFSLDGLPTIHKKIIVRARVSTLCTVTQNQSITMILSGSPNLVTTVALTYNTQSVIQASIQHSSPTLTITFKFGILAETCRKMIQDISIFYEKCQSYCGSNNCPTIQPYFKHISEMRCINDCSPIYSDSTTNWCVLDCPNGYTQGLLNSCSAFQFCHSTCETCTVKNNANECSTCTSTSALSYQPFPNSQTTGPCTPTITNNAQYLLTINKDTVIGPNTDPNSLISVTYNSSIVQSTLTTALSSFLYIENVIEFTTLSSNTVVFNFDSLPAQHEKIIVRAKVFTECSGSQDKTVQLTLSGSTPTVTNTTLTPLLQTIVEGEVLHTTPTFTLTVAFGTQSETCRKIVQDISLYFEKCSSFCGSNDCPATLSYYRDPTSAVCVSDCPDGYTEAGDLCVETKFCHSTCGACTIMNDATKCTSCSSTLGSLVYEPFAAGVTETTCAMTATNNAQLLMTVDKDTPLGGTSYLQSVTYNTIPEIALTPLSAFLYTQNVIEVSSLTNNTLVFDFGISPIHQKLLVRARVFTECTTENTTVQMTLSGGTPTVVTQSLSTNATTIIEGEVAHNSATFTLTFQFGTQVETCRKQIQDISIYYQRCQAYCGSNDCPDTEPYYKHPTFAKCVSNCPLGYIESSTNCVLQQLCHSSCDTCLVKNDALSCSSCPSTISQLSYNTLPGGTGPGICSLTLTNNAQLLITVNKNTLLRTSTLKSVTYNSILNSTTGTPLSSLLYSQNIIDFNGLTNNTVIFDFDFLPIHKKLFVRAKVFTQCAGGQNQLLSMTLSGDIPTVVTSTITPSLEEVIEGQIIHSAPAFTLTFQFGSQGDNCRKIVQDISVYYEKCLPYCQSNDCPSIEPYYKQLGVNSCVNNCSPNFAHPLDLMCVANCPNGYTQSGSSCVKVELCHSTCSSCSVFNDPTKCTTCSSSLTSLTFDPFAAGVTASTCSIPSTNNAQYLMTVDKNTPIGSSFLTSVDYNLNTVSTTGVTVGSLIYTQNVIEFKGLTSNTISYNFVNLPIHQKLIVRLRAQTQCNLSQNQTLQLTLTSINPQVIISTLVENVSTIVESQVTHDLTTFTLTIQFGTQGQVCRKMIQDVSIFYEKCLPYCQSNNCPDTLPYYKHPSQSICVNQCPAGYIEAGQNCNPVDYCHSTCATCTLKLDPLQCASCQSNYLLYATPLPVTGTQGACIIQSTDKWVPIINIDKNTILGTSLLKNVTYNTNSVQSTSGTTLGSFLFSQNTIEFSSFTSNLIRLQLLGLPTHFRLFARIRAYTQCTVQNMTIVASLDGSSTTYILTSSIQELIQTTPIDHNTASLILTIQFGTQGEICRKMVQDISIFGQKCAAYCTSCIDGGSVKQFSSTNCLLTCPAGQFISADGTQCLQCQSPCAQCSRTSTNCTRCTLVSGTQYYLNDTTPNDPLTGGVCVTQCLSNFYQDPTSESCQLCDPMCLSCVNTPSNCTSCSAYGGLNYFLQPTTGCMLTCPVGYYSNALTFTCTLCDSRCISCTGPTNSSCSACKVDSNNVIHYLVANTTTCTDVCVDNKFYANSTTFKCEPCDSNCDTCSLIATNCTTCKTSRESQFIYMQGNRCVTVCSANLLLYNNKCITTCPQGTKQSSVNNTLMCTICDGPCQKPTFKMQTVVVNGGKQLSHKVNFETGLHPSNTAQGIKESVKLWLVSQQARRLLQQNDYQSSQVEEFSGHKTRLLLRLQLSVDDLIISPDFQSITVRTPNPFSSSSLQQLVSTRIQIQFLAPVNDANGVPYTQTISDFSLQDKKFIQSFYSQIGNDEYMAIGIVLCILTAIAFSFSLYVYDRKVIHEILNFIMTIEIIGLIRMRAFAYPYIDLSWTLFGFSMFEFDWIPNSLKLLYPNGYSETIYANVSLTYDNQSLFTTWGSTLQVFVAMELALLIYYLVSKFRAIEPIKQVRQRTKFIQHCILSLVMVKTVFSNILCLTSFSIMQSSSNVSVIFWVAELFSILIFLIYFIYLVLHVKRSTKQVLLERIRNSTMSITPQKTSNFDEMNLNQTTTNLTSPIKVSPMKGSPEKFDLNHPQIVAQFLSQTSENPQNQQQLTGIKRCLANTKFEEIQMYKLFAFLKAIFVVIVVSSKGFGGIILIIIVQVAYFSIDMYFWCHERYNLKLFIVDEILTLVAYNTACFVQYDTKVLHGLLIVAVYGIFLIKTYYIVTAYLIKRNLPKQQQIKQDKQLAQDQIVQMVPIQKKSTSVKQQTNKHQTVRNDISMQDSLREQNLPDNKLITIGSEKQLRRTHNNIMKDIDYEEVFDYRNVQTIDYAEVPTGEMDERDKAKLKNKNPSNPQDKDTLETAYGTFYQQKQSPTNSSKQRLKIKKSNVFEQDNNLGDDDERSSRNELISINSHQSMLEHQNLNQRKKRVRSKKQQFNPLPQLSNRQKSTGRGNEIRLVDQQIEDKEVEVINIESKPVQIQRQNIIEKPKQNVPQAPEKVITQIQQNKLPENKPQQNKISQKMMQQIPEKAIQKSQQKNIQVVQAKIQDKAHNTNKQIIQEKAQTRIQQSSKSIVNTQVPNQEKFNIQSVQKQQVTQIGNTHPISKNAQVIKPEPVKHDDFKQLLSLNFNSTPAPSQKQQQVDHRPSTSYDDGKQRVKRQRKLQKPQTLLIWQQQQQQNNQQQNHRPATSYVSNEGNLLSNQKPATNNIKSISPIIQEPEVILSNRLNDSLTQYEQLAGENIDIQEKFVIAKNQLKEEKIQVEQVVQPTIHKDSSKMNSAQIMGQRIQSEFQPPMTAVQEQNEIQAKIVEIPAVNGVNEAQVINTITQQDKKSQHNKTEIINNVQKPSLPVDKVEKHVQNKAIIFNAQKLFQLSKQQNANNSNTEPQPINNLSQQQPTQQPSYQQPSQQQELQSAQPQQPQLSYNQKWLNEN